MSLPSHCRPPDLFLCARSGALDTPDTKTGECKFRPRSSFFDLWQLGRLLSHGGPGPGGSASNACLQRSLCSLRTWACALGGLRRAGTPRGDGASVGGWQGVALCDALGCAMARIRVTVSPESSI